MKVPQQPESRADKIIVQPEIPARSGSGGGRKPRKSIREEVKVVEEEEAKIKEVEERAKFEVDADHER